MPDAKKIEERQERDRTEDVDPTESPDSPPTKRFDPEQAKQRAKRRRFEPRSIALAPPPPGL